MAETLLRFGRELREERERRGLTLEQVAQATRFSVRHLQSLEADLFDELPGGVLRKGIVRGYCRHIGLDDETWMDRFAASGGLDQSEPDLAAFAENVHRARLEAMPPVRRRWWGVVVLTLAVLALAYAVWHYVVEPRVGLHWQRCPQPNPTPAVTASMFVRPPIGIPVGSAPSPRAHSAAIQSKISLFRAANPSLRNGPELPVFPEQQRWSSGVRRADGSGYLMRGAPPFCPPLTVICLPAKASPKAIPIRSPIRSPTRSLMLVSPQIL